MPTQQLSAAASLSLGSSDMTLARTLWAPLRGIRQPLQPESLCVRLVHEVEAAEVDPDAVSVAPVVAVGVLLPFAGSDVIVTPLVHVVEPLAQAGARHGNIYAVRIVALG